MAPGERAEEERASDRLSFDMTQWMEPSATAAFDQQLRRRSLSAGQSIYTQQEPGSEMYRIVSGSVRLTTRRPDGREAIFLLFGPRDWFGVSSLVDQEPRPQTAECLSAVELDVLGYQAFKTLIDQHPSFSRAVMILLARQMRVVSQYYEVHSLGNLASRVAGRIFELATASSAVGTETAVSDLAQSDLAAMVGASRQSVNKVLQTFQQEGLISLGNRAIRIRDIDALRRRSAVDVL